ncbi:hypothetical protein [Pseudorhodoplanes sinuspersici]|uniref:Uncharacterized protein n=1 Tax=Pseudorhodoplanes sinuspersici TaxID=1235591 RepID=A0A1W6ZKT7_9HYPH|nr:hypothetical protein [Pseudorhodoplanes sinuspersici]ARP98033.1 hypothetical protein CAK95_02275 [Pseudorhodoplanes sinuspersici]RKE68210.1 hypothetical protein DFP91_4578 [Pseudorhodoplanes sinuspersici]
MEELWEGEAVRLANEEEDALLKKGAQLTKLGAEQGAKVTAAFEQGVWNLVASKEPKEAAEFQAFAKRNGLSN